MQTKKKQNICNASHCGGSHSFLQSHSFHRCLRCQPNQSIFFSSLFFIVVAVQLMPIILFHYFFFHCCFQSLSRDSCLFVFLSIVEEIQLVAEWKIKMNSSSCHCTVKRSKSQTFLSRNAYKHTRISDFLFIDFGSYIYWSTQWVQPFVNCVLTVCLSSPKYHISDLIFANHRDCRRQRWSTERHHDMIYVRNSQRKYWYAIQTIVRWHSD